LIAENLPLLEAFFAAHTDIFEWYLPDGGCIGFPRYLGGEGVEKFVNDVTEKTGVLFLPASSYRSDLGFTPTDRFRIGCGRANMEEGLVV
jgi:aspartate/methionine/tyrosine aminotransferase